jgi:diguanylate cyclase (GGDEF)-like protein
MPIQPSIALGEDQVLSIVGLCLSLDSLAADIYMRISASCATEDLRSFWREMADEEREHANLWERVLSAGRRQRLPPIFDDPEAVRESLQGVMSRVRDICQQWESSKSISHPFVLACRLELSMLHPAFATLFYFARAMLDTDFYTAYETHLNRFIQALHAHCDMTPELELLGETLQRLWNDNRLLTQYATHDELTGLLNRRGFWILARQLAYFSHRNRINIGVLMLDIDDFRLVNERHGHLAGDRVLKKVGAAIQARLRRSDILGRYGGEEFIVFFPAIRPDGLGSLAEEIRQSIEQLDADGIRVTVSVGATQRVIETEPEGELSNLIARADALLYAAKHAGKNQLGLEASDG